MSLLNSSNQSEQQTKKMSDSSDYKKGRKDLDLRLKLEAARAFMCQGCFIKVNLGLSEPLSKLVEKRNLVDITDIDVMAIKYNYDFCAYTVCMSCKGGQAKNLSAIRESFYLKGVMDYFGGNKGYVIFDKKPVMSHARLLASKLGITVMEGDEFTNWCKSAQISCSIDYSQFWQDQTFGHYGQQYSKIDQLQPLRSYLALDYWFFKDFRNIQNILAYTTKAADLLSKPILPVKLTVLEVMMHFALSMLDLCSYVSAAGAKDVEDHVSSYLFGSVTALKSRQDLLRKVGTLLKKVGAIENGGPQLPPLVPNYTPELIEMVYRWISKPWAAINVPQVLQTLSWNHVLADLGLLKGELEPKVTIYDDISYKYADDLSRFVSDATGVHRIQII